jgi:membrane-bound lytic murein transglycosylase A
LVRMKKDRRVFLISVVALTVSGALGCYPLLRKETKRPAEALKQIHFYSFEFRDDMDRGSLTLAIKRNIEFFDRIGTEALFHYGQHDFTGKQVRETQVAFLDLLAKGLPPDQFNREIRKRFRVYRASGQGEERQTLFTGYYEPIYEGRLAPDDYFRYPLYRPPEDLRRIDLSPFGETFKGENIVVRIDGKKVIPYYSRYQIDVEQALRGKGLEIGWLKDPLDVAFLHIQGSGRVRLRDGKDLLVQYQISNGRPYRSIGRYMIERGFISADQMSMQAIRRYLTRNPEVLEEVLNYNPSYVFFQPVEQGPSGSLGVLLTPGRSVALDSRIFPKGALGFIVCQKPSVNDQGEITGWTPFSRFVLNQDSGGAIKGSGRVDIFWGSGTYAEVTAGHLQHQGDLYLLIKKP